MMDVVVIGKDYMKDDCCMVEDVARFGREDRGSLDRGQLDAAGRILVVVYAGILQRV